MASNVSIRRGHEPVAEPHRIVAALGVVGAAALATFSMGAPHRANAHDPRGASNGQGRVSIRL